MTPKGFSFAAIRARFKPWDKEDFGLIASDRPCAAAAVFTTNRAKAAPVLLDMKHIKSKTHRAIIVNSGCANAATGATGYQNALKTARLAAKALGCRTEEVLVASTGVIGVHLNPKVKIEDGVPLLAKKLGKSPAGFVRAIMTTDTKPKSASKSVMLGGKKVTIWGSAKGAGMIHPDMATMLSFVVTDANVPKPVLQSALKQAADKTFNRLTIDGDTSTNDTLAVLANGAAENAPLKTGTPDFAKFTQALSAVCDSLSGQIVADGEGVSRIARISVEKAASQKEALAVARAIAGSLLVKTALHGGDPNWGRIICAAGYSGEKVNPDKMELYFGRHCAFRNGQPASTPEKLLSAEMNKKKVAMRLVLNRGAAGDSYLFCDISHEYVTINSHYRT
ncbi:MAG: bifunctional glutamate N-acetyltransferase/amino-acid acetyltransferase ArgJ [Nitrospinae bacterium]|nr:bifunctional glutamate N-acetyltransferase/amino-acid acetyltransferase ArgJ [Nitrospinota bacterium]